MAESPANSAADETRRVGRGALLLTITKFWFLATSYVIVSGLAAIFGDDEAGVADFGKYRTVTTLASIINAFVVVGTQQAVSRFVGRDPERGDGVRRTAYRLQAILGGSIFVLLNLIAPVLAERVYESPELTTPLRFASLITLFYAFYAVFMGYLNGRKLFGRQALVDFSYATMKCVLILGFAAGAAGALGTVAAPVAGFAAAAGVALVLGMLMSGRARGEGEISVRSLFNFQSLTMAFAGLSSFVLQFDLHVLKILGPGGEEGEYLAGLYGAAQQFSQIPFQAVFAITFVLFPLVSGAAERDPERMRAYVRETTRYAVIIATGIVALFVACPERTINILFGGRYAEGAAVLRWLATGYLAYAPFYVLCSILNAAGRPRTSLALIVSVALVQVALGAALVGRYGATGVAAGTCVAMLGGLVFAHLRFRALYDQGVVVNLFARTFAAGAVTALVAHFAFARHLLVGEGAGLLAGLGGDPGALASRLVTVVGFAALGLAFLGLLFVLGVLNAEDRQRFARVLRRG